MAAATASPPRAIPPLFGRDFFRSSAISLGAALFIGAVIGYVEPRWVPGVFIYAALIGLTINFLCHLFDMLYRRWARRRGYDPSRIVLALLFFLGGALGWTLATLLAGALSIVSLRFFVPLLPFFLGLSGLVAIIVGLLIYTFGVLRERLETSVSRLKEVEFAEKELELARAIQRRLLPPPGMEGEGWSLAARNIAARYVAGDFYDVFHLADGTLGIVVADVAGKGMGASLIMASVKAVLPLLADGRSVGETLRELNRKLVSELAAREFVALAYLRFDPKRGAFSCGNAGLPDPYLFARHGAPAAVSVPGPRLPLGIRRDVPYETVEGSLEPGGRLLLFTDGLPEAPTEAGEPIGYERLEALLDSGAGSQASPADFLDSLLERVRAASRPTLEDDWTVLLLERRS